MTKYKCNICNAYTYDDSKGDKKLDVEKGTVPKDFSASWKCPVCMSNKSHMKAL
jgi:methylamine---glutamate N-methyltransferase subunit C